jgi:hypothetical protein
MTTKANEPSRSAVSTSESHRRLTDNRYQPIAGSRAIGEHLDATNNRSSSFRALIEGIRRLEAELLGA